MSTKLKVLVFGGAFSPPTVAHEAIVAACLELPQFDEVWLLPSGDRLDKTIAATDDDRQNMLEVIRSQRFNNNPRLKISDFELNLPRPTKTSRTFPLLEQQFPDREFWMALGRDSYLTMPDWPDGQTLRQTLKMAVFFSGPDTLQNAKNVMAVRLPEEIADVSSTAARQSIKAGDYANLGVSQPVLDYIRQNNLYT